MLYPLHSAVFEPILPPGTARTEYEIYHARLVSARKWSRRRRMLRLRAALFGRRKTKRAAPCEVACTGMAARPKMA